MVRKIDRFILALFKDFLRKFTRVFTNVNPMKTHAVIFELAISAFYASRGRIKCHKFGYFYVSIIVVYILQFSN